MTSASCGRALGLLLVSSMLSGGCGVLADVGPACETKAADELRVLEELVASNVEKAEIDEIERFDSCDSGGEAYIYVRFVKGVDLDRTLKWLSESPWRRPTPAEAPPQEEESKNFRALRVVGGGRSVRVLAYPANSGKLPGIIVEYW